MKKLYALFLLASMVSCSNRETGQDAGEKRLAITLDTVMVDPGDEIIYLKRGLSQSVVSKDGRFLFNFNADNYLMEKISLDELRLVGQQQMEREGPNGLGSWVSRFMLDSNDDFLILSMDKGGIFDAQGNKKRPVEFSPDKIKGDEWGEHENLTSGVFSSSNPEILYGALVNYFEGDFSFGIIDLKDNSLKKISLSENDYQKEYFFTLRTEEGSLLSISGPVYYVDYVKGQVYISNNADNGIFVYSPAGGAMERRMVDHRLFPHRKTGKYLKETSSMDRYAEIMNAYNEEINYKKPVWDAKNERFYRFSYQTKTTTDADGQENRSSKVWLSAFDSDLNLVGETLLEGMTKEPGQHFVRDGVIWMFENLEDEMGFVRFSVKN